MDTSPEKLLTNSFFEFYEIIAQLKGVIKSEDPQSLLPTQMRSDGAIDYNSMAAFISRRLEVFLDRKTKEIGSSCTEFEIKMFLQAKYIMSSLADEIFILEFDWAGAEYWPSYLLEKQLFNSDASGNVFFEKLDYLLKDRSGEYLIKDLATVFLMALRLGFSGRYRGSTSDQHLAEYQKKLLIFIGGTNSSGAQLFKKAYDYCIAESISHRLAPFSPWIKGALVMLVVYLVVSGYIWYSAIDELMNMVKHKGVV